MTHILAGGGTIEPAAVGEPTPRRVDLLQIGIIAPVLAVDQLQQPGAVGARLGAEDPHGRAPPIAVFGAVRLGVRTQIILGSGFIQTGGQRDGIVEHGHHMRKGIAEESGDAHGDIDPRAPQFCQRYGLQTHHAPRGVVPYRSNTQQRKHFGDIVA
ncbi:Uncharacterised protein [Mycobacteroides abscessus subsp. abscessus]|nr:Uncharacterised protein [Mycobacteroides abscessus subsp. abscessus]